MIATDYNSLNKIENHESIQIKISKHIEKFDKEQTLKVLLYIIVINYKEEKSKLSGECGRSYLPHLSKRTICNCAN
jgi:hypothetical protein